MRILIAPDKFKASLGAGEVAENIAAGIRETLPEAEIEIAAMADGGEGTAQVICQALGGIWITTRVHDPIGREINARYCWIEQRKLAVIEMSEAAGMRRLRPQERDPLHASTFGVGEMLLDAAAKGASTIIVGLGGSATNDAGVGLARALGFRFLRADQSAIEAIADLPALHRIARPDANGLSRRRIIAAADVRNVLLGDDGATRVFGPQKGANAEEIELLEKSLSRLAQIVARDLHNDYADEPGAGAAGGLGFGLMSFCGARMLGGFAVVAETSGLEEKVQWADIVITGEGSLDRQTLEGKTPAGVARMARNFGKRVFAIAGRATNEPEVRALFDAVYVLANSGISEQESIARAPELLREKAQELAKTLREPS